MRRFDFLQLPSAPLIVGAQYNADPPGTRWEHEPLHRLMPVGNQGGIRARKERRLVVLYTQWDDPDWPDALDPETGTLAYFGDNKRPGREIHDTPKGGNRILRDAFGRLAAGLHADIPPFFVFSQLGGRNVRFEGLAVPGSPRLAPEEALTAIWRTTSGQRFQNYRAVFTILDVATVERSWIKSLTVSSESLGPPAWRAFAKSGAYSPLLAPRTITHRTKSEQLPSDDDGRAILAAIRSWFADDPIRFEACAAEVWQGLAPNTVSVDLTRPTRDGGRDAVGQYSIGPASDRVHVDFALEAKCYSESNSVGVREMSRLISRLRHRQFGVLVTTSYVADQAYREVRDDQHPVAILSGSDIVDCLRHRGLTTEASVKTWLAQRFPKPSDSV